ncbi:MAG: type VI secretion system baseplate subunit TssF [Gammaproteobacteria bacterium]|nr:type VI secretion system baseplate subunit TssF [Gammaproteobacteria bacterium]
MNKYFQAELDRLKGVGKEFSEANPTLAPQLAQSSSDPDVERILEGVAFLSAGIRQKIDDDFPEFSQGLLNQIFPHYLRPIPSATIMEFTPKSILKGALSIPEKSYVDSIEVDEVSCRFSTSSEVRIAPTQLTAANTIETPTGRKAIELELRLNGINISAWSEENLRLFVAGDYRSAVDIFYILFRYIDQISILDEKGQEHTDSSLQINAAGFDESFKLLDYPSNSFPAYRLIQEYFLLKEKFLYFDIVNLKTALRKIGGSQFRFRFYLQEMSLVLPKLSADRFKLYTTPAINLFQHEAESFLNDYKRFEYPLRPVRNSNQQYHIYSVGRVEGNNRKLATKNVYKSMGLSDPDNNTSPVFQTFNRQSQGQHDTKYISFSYPESVPLENRETVTAELTCSNGKHPSKLKQGDISKRTSGMSEMVDFSNIIAPSESQDVPSGNAILWRLLSHLSLNYLSLADADNLKALLELYIFSGDAGNKQNVANRSRINSIQSVTVQACDRLVDGISMRGQSIDVVVDPSGFTSVGDMFLFGMLLNHLMSSFASLNSFTEFSLINSATEETYSWPIRTGGRPLI